MAQAQPALRPLERIGLVFLCSWVRPETSTSSKSMPLGLPHAIRRGIPLEFWLLAATYREPREILQHLVTQTLEVYSAWVAKPKTKESQNGTDSGSITALSCLRQDVEPLATPAGTDNSDATTSSGSILWLGNRRKTSEFVLFFHSGGDIAPLNQGHLTWC
ncbi:alpha/beta hydrolase fold protein [Colletotrichum orchidophilum]|uniref:Alpha/beta hydrolase fold protein n=1 Tax=Colletotrichum orchidophilum TaxID=1209926 RepID=A0A1G4B970_9PEZI|nr:alpha/beta hydrolase fold protein [Colletotrichum orchidophilum]OHE97855.1 alpha/beta hydrolase fold protein [Colletotrichum orchidophilum]